MFYLWCGSQIAANTALVGAVEDVTCLLEEYSSDPVYQQKVVLGLAHSPFLHCI